MELYLLSKVHAKLMFTDPRLPPPATEEEAKRRFTEAWAAAERAIASRQKMNAYLN